MKEFDIPVVSRPTPLIRWLEPHDPDMEQILTPEDRTKFQSLLGALSHIARMTRPEVLLAVFYLATFTGAPTARHYEGLVRITQHLHTDPTRGIRFAKDDGPLWEFYCDSEWAGCRSLLNLDAKEMSRNHLVKLNIVHLQTVQLTLFG
jgi:hypothetical protein